ncbi:NAD-P-binding protein [Mycena rosella]|uniref:NAD-P-binding protein n=1 Tax=Mycena rosella TaxID=1033263 RepID=A0AAD7M751_MYCRO|nr:NAD-P-binding protein [Mycena rosella]
MAPNTKLILVIGATGAQGQAVIDALLSPNKSGQASPWRVRALTRDPTSSHAQALAARGVESVRAGSFSDAVAVATALDGAYGAWVNTDGFTVGEAEEIYAGMRIFEIAKQTASMRHYVWSNLRYVFKKAGYNTEYKAEHMDAKGRVGEWLNAQPSDVGPDGLAWSQVTTGPYMDTLQGGIFSPLNVRADGTVVFAAPVEGGRVPLIALKDLGWWARWTFDHREETSARELNVTTERVDWEYLVATFTKVTGKRAVFKRLTLDEWWANFDQEKIQNPIANAKQRGDGSTTIRENISRFWRVLRDDVIDKDMEWIRSVHPDTYTLERWMRENEYDGQGTSILKNTQDGKNLFWFNPEVAASL